ncbi:MAG: tripartite tricarboxylate transporter TctB family protein [Rubrivivax sp.]|nr:tripartite tricarboxylate transporter TctB family protein [Rubrivivax sp.]
MSDRHDDAPEGGALGVRWPELLTALLMMGVAAVVMFDSRRIGAGWADDGPQSGYFPFYVGLAMFLASAWTAGVQLARWRRVEVFAERAQLRSVWTILWPMTLYVALVPWLGIYVSSTLLIAFFMLRHGRHGAALTAAVAVGVPLVFFLVFERWFLVPLPKGPIEALLGF